MDRIDGTLSGDCIRIWSSSLVTEGEGIEAKGDGLVCSLRLGAGDSTPAKGAD